MAKYGKTFYDGQVDASLASAREVVPIVIEGLAPQSVVDIGCGTGTWLSVFRENGSPNILGLDGPWAKQDGQLIDEGSFHAATFNPPPDATAREAILAKFKAVHPDANLFDLCMSLEVAEHIDPPNANAFVAFLTSLSDAVLFSAAIPGQGGTGHVNEQQLSYWAAKFMALGYSIFDVVRPRIWDNETVRWNYRQNMVLFCKDGSPIAQKATEWASSTPPLIDIAHPWGFWSKSDLKYRFITKRIFTAKRDGRKLLNRLFSPS